MFTFFIAFSIYASITIFLIEIPFTFFEVLLEKSSILIGSPKAKYIKKKSRTIALQVMCWILLSSIFVMGWLNTSWIALTKYLQNEECAYLNEFLLSSLLDNLVYELLIMLSKSLIYLVLLRNINKKYSCTRRFLLCVVASTPWLFALKG